MTSFRSQLMRLYVRYTASKSDPNQPVPEKRVKLEKDSKGLVKTPKGITVQAIQVGNVPAEWLKPANAEKGKAILYLHGGSYIIGSPRTHRGVAGRIALASDVNVLLLEYRLAPECPFPAALDDALSAYQWLLDQGIAPRHIAIGGDSAGGGLTVATAVALHEACKPLPAALFCISPWTDLTGSGESMKTRAASDPWLSAEELVATAKLYFGQNPADHPLISPLFADLRGLPPTLIHVGSDEVLLDDSRRLADKMKAVGVDVEIEIWPGMWHVFQAFAPYVPEANRAIDQLGTFVQKHLI